MIFKALSRCYGSGRCRSTGPAGTSLAPAPVARGQGRTNSTIEPCIDHLMPQPLVSQALLEGLDLAVLSGRSRPDESGPGPDHAIDLRTASATNSSPLSQRIHAGTPHRKNSSVGTPSTSIEESFLQTRMARLSRANSPKTLHMRKARLSWVR